MSSVTSPDQPSPGQPSPGQHSRSTTQADLTGRDADDSRPIGYWLLAMAGLVFAMAVIGAITRLTESGLSIMEWAPISGTLPPLSQAEWERLFLLYQTIPQYQQMNAGMSLAEFKEIFWWEYVHRLWGRLIGLVFAGGFVVFLLRRRIPKGLLPHLIAMLALGGMQGLVGWIMVASGFGDDRLAVSQYRLAIHLGLAFAIYCYVLWIAMDLLTPAPQPSRAAAAAGLRKAALGFLALVSLTILAGALVAGTRAGFTYNTFPLMDGRLIPSGYGALSPWLLNHFENIATVQFNHRLLAVASLLAAIGLWVWSRRLDLAPAIRRGFDLVLGVTLLQLVLGIATLLLVVPVWLGALHQAGALVVLSATIWLLHRLRPA